MKQKILRAVSFLVIFYAAVLAFLYLNQRNLIYVPNTSTAIQAGSKYEFQTITDDGLRLSSFYSKPRLKSNPVILMFHGNAGHAGHRISEMIPFIDKGYGVTIAGYRGYGGNPGKPSEYNFYQDARVLIDQLVSEGVKPDQIILYGESLGTGVASKMASEYDDVKALILEAPYTSLADTAQAHYPFFPAKFLIKDRYETRKVINDFRLPILLLHGTKDNVISVKNSHELFEMIEGEKQLEIFDGAGHNDLNSYGALDKILEFIEGLEK